jgi:outer membrane lipoprotein-sorting protein
MRILPQSVTSTLLILLCISTGRPLLAQKPGTSTVELLAVLTEEEVVDRMVARNLERAKSLETFQGTRVYRLEYHGFPGSGSAEMVVDVKYQSPSTVEFNIRSATGSKLLIEKVFKKLLQTEKEELTPKNQRRVALNNENYSFTLAGQENTPSGSFYILSVEPRTKNKLLYRGRIWVDAEDFAVVRIEAGPAENPSFWIKGTQIEQIYLRVADFWLPASNRSTSNTRLGGNALLTIEYKDYRVTAIPTLSNSTGTDVPTKIFVLTELVDLDSRRCSSQRPGHDQSLAWRRS